MLLRLLGPVARPATQRVGCRCVASAAATSTEHVVAAGSPKAGVIPPRPSLRRRRAAPVAVTDDRAPFIATHTVHRTLSMAPPGTEFEGEAELLQRHLSSRGRAAVRHAATVGRAEASAAQSSAGALAGSVLGGAPADSSSAAAVPSSSLSAGASSSAAAAPAKPRLFAVISLGGTQYKVTPGDIINAEHVRGAEVGTTLSIRDVHAVGSAGVSVLGRPLVDGATVRLAVEEQTLDRKVMVFKKKRRKRYQRLQGHRRMVTRLRVESVECREGGLGAFP